MAYLLEQAARQFGAQLETQEETSDGPAPGDDGEQG